MNKKEKQKLIDKFNINGYSRGVYEQGFFDGLSVAEKYYNKRQGK